ncbi:uncharacterized protein LOC105220240 isoform X6 [Zeugodacus cucurbitae]|uniref:uncharacterized protein LOC105220240 isoform X6 n=1 Tax=Zeugodacus cucurbitae TaxID=28588 RepID=UPI0023D94D25|nr:uncharacterized protein LOC105220240 isoform X6 [Zeugodacus cucurbitae]
MDIFLLTQRSAMEEDTQRFLKSHGKRNPIPSNVDNGFNSVVEEYKDTDISKSDKEIANHAEVEIADTKIDKNDAKPEKKDEMDQWVSDSFYSYFPGYTNEYQKRQEILRNRQRENQENFIKHQEMLQTSQKQTRLVAPTFIPSNQLDPTLTKHCSGSTANMPLLTTTLSNDKTDLEIIVTNPNYQPTKYLNSRPNTTRHKLLRDLSHTALSSNEDIYADRNERVEFETNRKKEYQRELMEQIEEKRRNVQLLREKEHMEDEALTRRLQEQLKTINLEEKLAKENVLAEKDEENPLKQGGNSFHIFNLNTTSPNIYEDSYSSSSVGTVAKENENSTCHHIKNNLSDEKPQLLAFDSIEIKLNKSDKYCYLDDDENSCIDSVRRETDRHLSRYLKNYGDVALLRIDKQRSKSESRHRGTQTINSNLKRRDIMLNEEHNLSMPLLREMPKMTRKQFLNFPEMVVTQRKRKIDCLKRKWEVPAVQKCIITQNSPYILTQVGAIRKQLQAECLADAQFNSDDSIS